MSAHDEGTDSPLPLSTLHAFPVNYFIENIAVRASGELLLNVHNIESLYLLNPSSPEPVLLYKFKTGVCGIVEVEDDIFYISSGTIGSTDWCIYKVDMNGYSGGEVKPEKVAVVPEALFLNGSSVLDKSAGTMLAVDSILGAIFLINVKTGEVSTWLKDTKLGKTTDNPMMPGVNGCQLHKYDGKLYVYVSNTEARTFMRFPVEDGKAGAIHLVAENLNIDDFAFDDSGSVYLTTHVYQSVVKFDLEDGKRTRVAGGPEDRVVAGTTAAAFGRGEGDKETLYVTTTGGMSLPVGGVVGEGRVLALKVGVKGEQI
jgi:hypothetical protein